jgi:ribosomal protein S14
MSMSDAKSSALKKQRNHEHSYDEHKKCTACGAYRSVYAARAARGTYKYKTQNL